MNDENVPDYDEYLDLGAYYLPFLQHIELRIKASPPPVAVLGSTTTYYNSSLEVEAYAAPKTMGLWEDWREDFLAANPKAKAVDGVFGTEIPSAGRGVRRQDGAHPHRRRGRPRWMLRGIFSGTAASDPDSRRNQEAQQFSPTSWSNVARPLAPRDPIPNASAGYARPSARPLPPHIR